MRASSSSCTMATVFAQTYGIFCRSHNISPLRDIRWKFNVSQMHHFVNRWTKSKKTAKIFSPVLILKTISTDSARSRGMFACWFPAKWPPNITCALLRRRFALTRYQSAMRYGFNIKSKYESKNSRIHVKWGVFGMGSQSQSDSSQLTSLIVSFVWLWVA